MVTRRFLHVLGLLGALWFAAAPRTPVLGRSGQDCELAKASLSALHVCDAQSKKSDDGKWDPFAVAAPSTRIPLHVSTGPIARALPSNRACSRTPQTFRKSRAPPAA